jgi:folate-dependent phosphoribosylglycinamide formyltransferase PurN
MYGRRVHAAVLAQGVRVTGVTVHFVDAQYDHGPLIAQWPVPVHAADTPETLGARVLEVEHQLYPRVVALLAAGRITLDERGGVAGLPAPWRFPHFAAADEPGAGDVWDPALSSVA